MAAEGQLQTTVDVKAATVVMRAAGSNSRRGLNSVIACATVCTHTATRQLPVDAPILTAPSSITLHTQAAVADRSGACTPAAPPCRLCHLRRRHHRHCRRCQQRCQRLQRPVATDGGDGEVMPMASAMAAEGQSQTLVAVRLAEVVIRAADRGSLCAQQCMRDCRRLVNRTLMQCRRTQAAISIDGASECSANVDSRNLKMGDVYTPHKAGASLIGSQHCTHTCCTAGAAAGAASSSMAGGAETAAAAGAATALSMIGLLMATSSTSPSSSSPSCRSCECRSAQCEGPRSETACVNR
jgi:hypothetical protein